MRAMISLLLLTMLLVGCSNITTRTQLDHHDVSPRLFGDDCATWFLIPVIIGTVSLERAMATAVPAKAIDGTTRRYDLPITPITKVHRVQTSDYYFFFVGKRCVEVFGE